MLKYICYTVSQLVKAVIHREKFSKLVVKRGYLSSNIVLDLNSHSNLVSTNIITLSSFKRLLISLSLLLSIDNVYGLSATTTESINGNEPYLLLSDGVTRFTDINKLLGFVMPNPDDSGGIVQIDANMAGKTIIAPNGMKYSDVIPLITPDGKLYNVPGLKVGDEDGDADIEANTSVTGQIKATWYNGGLAVPASDLNKKLSACEGPYTLKIEIPNALNANTKYGVPNINSYGTHSGVTYLFSLRVPAQMCYIHPYSMQLYTSANGAVKYPLGYNPATWIRGKGFRVGSGFPSTGFYKAKFSLHGSGNNQEENYRCSSPDNGGKITLSGSASKELGANCMVTYNSATKSEFISGGTPTINMQYKTESGWVDVGSFNIPIPDKWALGKGQKQYGNKYSITESTSFPALDACRTDGKVTTLQEASALDSDSKAFRQKYMYRRDEISNTPYNSKPEGVNQMISYNYVSRDLGTFIGEWGNMGEYEGSPWTTSRLNGFWVAEVMTTSYAYYIGIAGTLDTTRASQGGIATLCRGD